MSDRVRNLLTFACVVLGLGLFAFSAYLTVLTYVHDNHHNDFTYYYTAARIGLHQGWSQIFDLDVQNSELGRVSPGLGVAFQSRYLNPPPLAWLVVPFTALPYGFAYWTWVGLSLAGLLVAWWLGSCGRISVRLAMLSLALGLLPVGFALQLGQPTLLVAGAVAVAAWLLRSERQVASGLVLSLAAIKPQLIWLVPACLLVAGYTRAFLAWSGSFLLFVAASLASLGASGVHQYLDLLSYAESLPVNHHLVVTQVFGPGPQVRVLQAALGLGTVAAARLRRDQGSDTVLAIGLLGSAAAAPYLHLADMALLVLAGWLYLRRSRPLAVWVFLAAGLLTMQIAYSFTPIPFFLAEVGALAALIVWRTGIRRAAVSAAEAAPA